jgi:hypothetical protein
MEIAKLDDVDHASMFHCESCVANPWWHTQATGALVVIEARARAQLKRHSPLNSSVVSKKTIEVDGDIMLGNMAPELLVMLAVITVVIAVLLIVAVVMLTRVLRRRSSAPPRENDSGTHLS